MSRKGAKVAKEKLKQKGLSFLAPWRETLLILSLIGMARKGAKVAKEKLKQKGLSFLASWRLGVKRF